MTRWASLGPSTDPFVQKSLRGVRTLGTLLTTRKKGNETEIALRMAAIGKYGVLDASQWVCSGDRVVAPRYSQYLPGEMTADLGKLAIDPGVLANLPALLAERGPVDRFGFLDQVVLRTPLAKLNDVLAKSVVPLFFQWYPDGRLRFVTTCHGFHETLSVLRVMGTVDQLVDRDFDATRTIGPFNLLGDAQPAGVFFSAKYLSVPLAIFLPRLYGFIAAKVTYAFMFLLDKPIEDCRGRSPSCGLHMLRSEVGGLFRQTPEVDLAKLSNARPEAFRLVEDAFATDDLADFLDDYTKCLGGFLAFLIDPSNFAVRASGRWVGLEHYTTWLAFARITDEILLLLTEETSYLRKAALFRVLDQMACLMDSDQRRQSQCWKRLILPNGSRDIVMEGIECYGGRMGTFLKELLSTLRDSLRQTTLGAIYLPNVYDPVSGKVKLPDGTEMASDDYVVAMVRELRNTAHGYHTKQFLQILSISSGATPEALPGMGVLAYLALLAKPELFVTREWKRL